MKRREFLAKGSAATLSLGLAAPLQNLIAMDAPATYVSEIGLQLYTVRNQLAADFSGTLAAIKEAGYWQVEAMDMDQLPQLLPIAQDLGLQVKSAFFKWPFITGNWDLVKPDGMNPPPKGYGFENLVGDAAKNGIEYLIFGYMKPQERDSLDEYKRVIEQLNRAGEVCKEAGVKLCYHNHSFEFGPIGGTVPYELLIAGFEPELIRFELDIFWASLGGYDPIKLMKRLDGRIRLLHLKDKKKGVPVMYDEQTVPYDTFKELGNGEINIRKVLKLAEKIGVEQCMVEQDQSPDPLSSIKTSRKYLG